LLCLIPFKVRSPSGQKHCGCWSLAQVTNRGHIVRFSNTQRASATCA